MVRWIKTVKNAIPAGGWYPAQGFNDQILEFLAVNDHVKPWIFGGLNEVWYISTIESYTKYVNDQIQQ